VDRRGHRDAEVAVIGVGSVGSMALWQLADRGIPAVGFEQFAPGHDRGAAGGESRVFRVAYHEGSGYTPWLLEARDEWRRLERAADVRLLDQCGYLEIAAADAPSIAATLAGIEEHGLDHEVLDARAAQKRFPAHRFRADDLAVLDRTGGALWPEYAVVSAARQAVARGARLVRRTRVERIEADDDGVTVHAGGRQWRFGSAIVTAGAWTRQLLPEIAGTVTPTRLSLAWFPAIEPARFLPAVFPAFGRTVGETFVYGIPTVDGRSVKVATTRIDDPDPVDPDRLDREVPGPVLERIAEVVAEYLPGLVPDPVRAAAYVDGYTPDGHGLVGLHPDHPNLVLVAGLSGHGFKLAPVFGKAAADLAVARQSTVAVDFLDPGRFLSGARQ